MVGCASNCAEVGFGQETADKVAGGSAWDELTELRELTAPPMSEPTEMGEVRSSKNSSQRAILYAGLDWKGKPTKVFAVIGLPKAQAEKALGAADSPKVPGVVLLHGGGGKAFPEWVEEWNARGFAAISMSLEGHSTQRESHPWSGPERVGIYGDSAQPLQDQWMYHAVADAILANSLLRSLPEVDEDRVGVTGISWGGVVTSTVIGIDQRFAFAIPIYGCGNLATAENQYGRALGNNAIYKEIWDPMLRFEKAKMPILWLSWPEDKHFPMEHLSASHKAAAGESVMALVPGMRHGHQAGWQRPESYAFAQSVLQSGRSWYSPLREQIDGSDYQVVFQSDRPIDKAVLVWTEDTGVTGERRWSETSATLRHEQSEWIATAAIPSQATAWFVNLQSGNLIASSDYCSRNVE